jgi:hypothetical protein
VIMHGNFINNTTFITKIATLPLLYAKMNSDIRLNITISGTLPRLRGRDRDGVKKRLSALTRTASNSAATVWPIPADYSAASLGLGCPKG